MQSRRDKIRKNSQNKPSSVRPLPSSTPDSTFPSVCAAEARQWCLACVRLAAYHKDSMRCYVIGDIHGCLDELRYLIEGLPLEFGDRLVFLGDYVDRGPNSKGVLNYILELQKEEDLEL